MMARQIRKGSPKAGLPPGTVVHVGAKRTEPTRITVIRYDQSHLEEAAIAGVEECLAETGKDQVTWINVDGIHEVEIIEKLGSHFNLHPLILEDIVNTTQRPKLDEHAQNLFVVAKMLSWDQAGDCPACEQVSFVLGRSFLLTFQEVPGDVFELIRQRIRSDRGQIRKMGADYLLYALLDAIIDYYFVVLEHLGDRIEELEDQELTNPTPHTLKNIRQLKRMMIDVRRAAWPMREIAGSMDRSKTSLLGDEIAIYLRDLYDHAVEVLETTETYRDTVSGLLDVYLSSMSNRMNEVMKVLTIIATIFIPLTFIAGVYGMNFDPNRSPWNMPELRWYMGYPAVMAIMAIVTIVMVLYFRRKRWI